MSGSQDEIKKINKAQKKAAKSQTKLQKKLTKQDEVQHQNNPAVALENSTIPTPAERSAIAAEKQVALQRYRVWFALLMIILTSLTLWYTMFYKNTAAESVLSSDTKPISVDQ